MSVPSTGVNSMIQTDYSVCGLSKLSASPRAAPLHCSLAPLLRTSRGEEKVRKLKPVDFFPFSSSGRLGGRRIVIG